MEKPTNDDSYDISQSLKYKTRTKRAQGKEKEFVIKDEMDIAKITIKKLFSASKTKALLTHFLGNTVLEEYKASNRSARRSCVFYVTGT